MLFNQLRNTVSRRAYSTGGFVPGASPTKSKGFFYQFGTPLVKCAVIATTTTMAYQLLWQHLDYEEYRLEAEANITKLENRLKQLEEKQQ